MIYISNILFDISKQLRSRPIFRLLFLLCKFVKYLLDCSLFNGVLLNTELLFVGLKELKEPTNLCLCFDFESNKGLQPFQ
jgi:hypothetical protein